jgi:hypothetical protein
VSTAEGLFPAYLVRGDDPVITGDAVKALVAELVGDDDPSFVLEELSGDEYTPSAVVDAAQTPPFFGDRRVVVARDVGRFTTAEAAPLIDYLADPLPTTKLVLVGGGGQLPRTLVDAVRKVGHVVDTAVPSGRGRSTWLAGRLKEAPVRLDASASALVGAHLGEEVGRLAALLDTLAAAYGKGARVGVDEVTPLTRATSPPPSATSTACWPPAPATRSSSSPPCTPTSAGCCASTGRASPTSARRPPPWASRARPSRPRRRSRPPGVSGPPAWPGPSPCSPTPTWPSRARWTGHPSWCWKCSSPVWPAWRPGRPRPAARCSSFW